MRLGHSLTGEHMRDGSVEERPGHRLAVAWGGLVEGTSVGQPPIRVVEEEIRRARRAVGPADRLVTVHQIGKVQDARWA